MSDPKKTSRRDFLRGRSAIKRVQEAMDAPLAPPLPQSSVSSDDEGNDHSSYSENYLEHYSHNAMACQFQILLNHRQFRDGPQFALDAFHLIDHLETKLSSYRETSEVSRMNREASENWAPVDPEVYQLLTRSKLLFELTKGAFDVTTGPLAKIWGFDKRDGSIPSEDAIESALKKVSTNRIQLDDSKMQVRFRHPTTQIDFNSIGKGYALDRVAQVAKTNLIDDFIIHGGQSSVLARGNCLRSETPNDNSQPGWTVGLSHPTLPECRLAEIHLVNESLATSGTARQGFFHNGRRYGHVIDPRTGWPTDHCLSSTVITSNAADADALATAFFVMSVDEVEAYCLIHPEIKAILVLPGEGAGKTDLVWFNLTDQDWTRLV